MHFSVASDNLTKYQFAIQQNISDMMTQCDVLTVENKYYVSCVKDKIL